METNAAKRISALLADRQDEIAGQGNKIVRDTLRSRLTRAELARQLGELYAALRTAVDGGQSIESSKAGELNGILRELSASRARQGFSASETAISVFAVKDAVHRATGGSDDQLS